MKKTFYIFSSGAFQRRDNTVYFESEKNERRFIPVEDIADITVFGEVSINKRFLEFLSHRGIILHYFNHYGYYMGSFYPREHFNSGYMLLKQAEYYLDPIKRLSIARRIVDGSTKNLLRVLKYYKSRGINISKRIDAIEYLANSIAVCNNPEALMSIEGNIRDQYYRAFDSIIGKSDFIFESRTRRPPRNRLNTLISFGNSLLYTICLSEVYRTHLDPRIGFLHSTNFRRFTLNLDIAELFKPIIVDRVIFSVIKKCMITMDDYEERTEGLLLKDKAKRCFIEQLEKKLKTTINHREIGKSVSYRRLIRLELYKLEKHLIGEKEYVALTLTW